VIQKFPANGSDESLNERMRAWRHEYSPHNLQPGHHRLIQQINRLLEPLILDERCVCLLSCLDRSMAKQMLNVSNGSTSTQQASGKCFSKIVRGNTRDGSPFERTAASPWKGQSVVAAVWRAS